MYFSEDTFSEIKIKIKIQVDRQVIDTAEEQHVMLQSDQRVAAKTRNGIIQARGL